MDMEVFGEEETKSHDNNKVKMDIEVFEDNNDRANLEESDDDNNDDIDSDEESDEEVEEEGGDDEKKEESEKTNEKLEIQDNDIYKFKTLTLDDFQFSEVNLKDWPKTKKRNLKIENKIRLLKLLEKKNVVIHDPNILKDMKKSNFRPHTWDYIQVFEKKKRIPMYLHSNFKKFYFASYNYFILCGYGKEVLYKKGTIVLRGKFQLIGSERDVILNLNSKLRNNRNDPLHRMNSIVPLWWVCLKMFTMFLPKLLFRRTEKNFSSKRTTLLLELKLIIERFGICKREEFYTKKQFDVNEWEKFANKRFVDKYKEILCNVWRKLNSTCLEQDLKYHWDMFTLHYGKFWDFCVMLSYKQNRKNLDGKDRIEGVFLHDSITIIISVEKVNTKKKYKINFYNPINGLLYPFKLVVDSNEDIRMDTRENMNKKNKALSDNSTNLKENVGTRKKSLSDFQDKTKEVKMNNYTTLSFNQIIRYMMIYSPSENIVKAVSDENRKVVAHDFEHVYNTENVDELIEIKDSEERDDGNIESQEYQKLIKLLELFHKKSIIWRKKKDKLIDDEQKMEIIHPRYCNESSYFLPNVITKRWRDYQLKIDKKLFLYYIRRKISKFVIFGAAGCGKTGPIVVNSFEIICREKNGIVLYLCPKILKNQTLGKFEWNFTEFSFRNVPFYVITRPKKKSIMKNILSEKRAVVFLDYNNLVTMMGSIDSKDEYSEFFLKMFMDLKILYLDEAHFAFANEETDFYKSITKLIELYRKNRGRNLFVVPFTGSAQVSLSKSLVNFVKFGFSEEKSKVVKRELNILKNELQKKAVDKSSIHKSIKNINEVIDEWENSGNLMIVSSKMFFKSDIPPLIYYVGLKLSDRVKKNYIRYLLKLNKLENRKFVPKNDEDYINFREGMEKPKLMINSASVFKVTTDPNILKEGKGNGLLNFQELVPVENIPKISLLMNILKPFMELGKNIIICSQFIHVVQNVPKYLRLEYPFSKVFKCFSVTSKTKNTSKEDKRNEAVLNWKLETCKTKFLSMTFHLLKVGWDLQDNDVLILMEPVWNADDFDQVLNRCDRPGRDKNRPLIVITLFMSGTVEEFMIQRFSYKYVINRNIVFKSGIDCNEIESIQSCKSELISYFFSKHDQNEKEYQFKGNLEKVQTLVENVYNHRDIFTNKD